MPQDWYILTPTGPEGPFRFWQLLKKVSMAPNTLVRKGTMEPWTPACEHEKLKPFLPAEKPKPKKPTPKKKKPVVDSKDSESKSNNFSDVLVSEAEFQPPHIEWWIWIVVLLLLLLTSWNWQRSIFY